MLRRFVSLRKSIGQRLARIGRFIGLRRQITNLVSLSFAGMRFGQHFVRVRFHLRCCIRVPRLPLKQLDRIVMRIAPQVGETGSIFARMLLPQARTASAASLATGSNTRPDTWPSRRRRPPPPNLNTTRANHPRLHNELVVRFSLTVGNERRLGWRNVQ